MKKVMAVMLCMFFVAVLFAASDGFKIKNVKIEGVKNVKAKTVLSEIATRKGKYYSDTTAREDIRKILSIGNFENAEFYVDKAGQTVKFTVTEKPYIKKIIFKGNKQFSSGKLKGEATLKEKGFFDKVELEESKRKILTLYKDKGYADCQIEIYPTNDVDRNVMTVTFLITENKKILIGDLIIEGCKSFKYKKIKKLAKTKKKKVYKEETLNSDIAAITKFYKDHGFMDFSVSEPVITYNEDRTKMFINLKIEEGAKYKIGDISFQGNYVVSEKELAKHCDFKKNDIFSQEKIATTLNKIYDDYSNRGYLQSYIAPDFRKTDKDGVVDVVYAIQENNKVYVGDIFIDGLTSTKEDTIRREILLKSGDVLSSGKVRRSMEKIYNLGFIDGVEPNILPTGTNDIMNLAFNVTEGKPGMITAGAGYSSIDQFVGSLQLQHMNLFGRAQKLNLLWEFGARRQNYQIDWTEPWFLNKAMSLGLSVYNMERLRDYHYTTDAYKEGRTGGSVKIGPRLSENTSLVFGYTYEYVNIFDIEDEDLKQQILNDPDLARDKTSSVLAQIIYDSRDYIYDATKGARYSYGVTVAGGPFGGNVHYIRNSARGTWFFPTFWKFVFSANLNLGSIESYGDSSDVPLYEKYYIGGADTVRGYKYRTEIGPYDGGKVIAVLNLEYKFPIVQENKKTILQGAFFYDVGGTWKTFNDVNMRFGTDNSDNNEYYLKSGVGFGIRFATPVFPLRLDWGYGLNHKPGEDLQQFYFTIGNAF